MLMVETEFHPKISRNSLSSAAVVIPLLLDLADIRSVIDFGCKHGEWLHVFAQHGMPRRFGVDRRDEASLLLIDTTEFEAADLARPFRLNGPFDLAVCIEVAEHLPKSAATTLVTTLTSAAPLVLFSAAVPMQGGHGHLNEQPRAYWDDMFRTHAFRRLDCLRPLMWRDPRVAWWYRQNLFLYATDQAICANPRLARAAATPAAEDLDLVHIDILNRRRWPTRAREYLRRILAR